MTADLVMEWTLRSSLLIAAAACLLWSFRIKASSLRLAAWTATLVGSFAMPALTSALPAVRIPSIDVSIRTAVSQLALRPPLIPDTTRVAIVGNRSDALDRVATRTRVSSQRGPDWHRPDWRRGAMTVYAAGALLFLLRMLAGLVMSVRLLRTSTRTGTSFDGTEVRESSRVATPLTLGLIRPVIVLPNDWRRWDRTTLNAVLAHERSHAGRRDGAMQLLSLLHRAMFWHNPLSWFLHRCIVHTAEHASDDAALAATGDRVAYAEILVRFVQRGMRLPTAASVPMARYGSPAQRIDRILESADVPARPTRRHIAAIVAMAVPLACIVAAGQTRRSFEVADVHVSPPRADGRLALKVGGGAVRGGRYEIFNATLVDMITTAYGVEINHVLGGPTWLAMDRFDVIAKAPDNADPSTIALMLQALLADRFTLVARADTRPMPAWVLSKAGEPKLKRAGSSQEPGCRIDYDGDRLSCRRVTMDDFVTWLRAGPRTRWPVVNATGLDGAWDFDLDGLSLSRMRGVSEDNPILTAVERRLGLKLALERTPQPVVIVDSVNRRPTANVADIEVRLPPDPVEFDVASIRPCETVNPRGWRISPSGQVSTGCQPLRLHIYRAWDLGPQRDTSNGFRDLAFGQTKIEGAPRWLDTKRFDILAKAPIRIEGVAGDSKYTAMLRNLLIDRFKMVTRYEDRLVDAYALVAASPRLKKADPSVRTVCRSSGLAPARQPGSGGGGYSSTITCQNATMAQFADALNKTMAIATSGRRVVDETGIHGGWDVTLTYRYMLAAVPAPGDAPDPALTSVPIEQAIEEQLGLKLKETKRQLPVFVIDHIEESPTDN